MKLSDVAELLKERGGLTLDIGGGMGRLYLGQDLVVKFREVFGRDPTDREQQMDWYDFDFERMKRNDD